MRKFLLILCALFISMNSAWAAYESFVATKVVQPDGTQLNIYASGDEFYNWLHDSQGYTIIQDKNSGWYVYAVKSGDNIVAGTEKAGKVNPASLNLEKWLKLSPERILALRNELFPMPEKPSLGKNENKTQTSNFGQLQNLVVFIRFSDQTEFNDPISLYDGQFNSTSNASLYSYLKDASYNKLEVISSFYPAPSASMVVSYQDANPRGYYSPYTSTNTIGYTNDGQRTSREHTLLVNAINAVKSSIPSNIDIDNDNDGYVDNVCFLVGGTNDAWASLLWPHRWVLYSQNVTINGARVWDYNFNLQSWAKGSRAISVLCHEMSHSLGYPDLYHYAGNGIQTVGSWDIMEADGNPPQHHSAYTKFKYGKWITSIPTITSSGWYSLKPLHTNSTNNAFKIPSPYSSTEFFVVEYRRNEGMFESSLPGTGLLVYRIDPSAGDGNADGPPDEVYLFRPNGTKTVNGNLSLAAYSSDAGRTFINDTANPKTFLQNGNPGGLNIYNIGQANANEIKFYVSFAPPVPTLALPANQLTGLDLQPQLIWNKTVGAITWGIQIAKDTGFTNIVYTSLGLTENVFNLPISLENGTKYYWRANAGNNKEYSEWSAYWSFTTKMNVPQLALPVNTEPRTSVNPKFVWAKVNGAQYYTLEIASDGAFSNVIFSATNILDNWYELATSLEYFKDFYWRVKAHNSNESTDWSMIYSFTTTVEKPVVRKQTASHIICKGELLRIDMIADGLFLNFQWLKDGKEIPDANFASLLLDSSGYERSSSYKCRITNYPGGTDTIYSSTVYIYVAQNAEILEQANSMTAKVGETAHFTFKAHIVGLDFSHPLQVQWYKGTDALTNNSKYAGVNSTYMTIKNVEASDFANDYYAVLWGFCGDTIQTPMLALTELLDPLYDTTSVSSCINNSVDLDMQLTPPQNHTLRYEWVAPQGCQFTLNIEGNKLTASNLRNVDTKFTRYSYLMPENMLYHVLTVNNTLSDIPVIVKDLDPSLTVKNGDAFELKVDANSDLNLTYQWYLNNAEINGETTNTLKVDAANSASEGKYSCSIKNNCGETLSKVCDIKVVTKAMTGIRENDTQIAMNVMPNPASNKARVTYVLENEGLVNIALYDALGNRLMVNNISDAKSGENLLELDLSKFANGIYYLSIESNGTRGNHIISISK